MTPPEETRSVLDIDVSYLDPAAVTDRFAFVATIVEAGRYEKINVVGDREDGTHYDFDKLEFFLPVEQVHPPRNEDQNERELKFKVTRNEAESILAETQPRLNPKTALGKLTDDSDNIGLPRTDTSEVVGHTVIISQWNETDRGGYNTTRYDLIADLGTGAYDLDAAIEVANSEMAGKKVVSADF